MYIVKSLIPEWDNPFLHAYLGVRKRDDECELGNR